MTYGVTSTGFAAPDIDTIRTEIEDAIKSELGDTVNLLSTSVLGRLVGILAEREADLWDAALAIYNAQYPDTATGQSLDYLCAITGTTRPAASKSTVALKLNLNAGVTVPVGSVVSQGIGSDVRFVTIEAATNSGGAPTNVYADAEAEETGPIAAATGTLTHIETAVSGWNSVTNEADAIPGRDVASDAELRILREAELSSVGSGTVDTIRARLLEVDDVEQAVVIENATDATVDSIPPHAFRPIVYGPSATDNDIAQSIWDHRPAGIPSYGTDSGTATDSEGGTHTELFDRASAVTVHTAITLTKNSDYPADGDAQIKAAIAAMAWDIGEDPHISMLYSVIFGIDGVVTVTNLKIGTTDPPTTTSVAIDVDEIADFDTANIDVTST